MGWAVICGQQVHDSSSMLREASFALWNGQEKSRKLRELAAFVFGARGRNRTGTPRGGGF